MEQAATFSGLRSVVAIVPPPVFGDLFSSRNARTFSGFYVDPYHPDGVTDRIRPPLNFASSNPNIRSELSDNYSLGFDWSPESLPGVRWTVDWSRIDFTDKISSSLSLVNSHPEVAFALTEIVERDAAGYITQINATVLNLAKKVSELVDTRLEYNFATGAGDFTAMLNYTRVLGEFFQVTEGTERIGREGTASGSNEYNLSGALTWLAGRFATDIFIYYTPATRTTVPDFAGRLLGNAEVRVSSGLARHSMWTL